MRVFRRSRPVAGRQQWSPGYRSQDRRGLGGTGMVVDSGSPMSGPSGGVGWNRRLAILAEIRRLQDDLKHSTDERERHVLLGIIESRWDEYRWAEQASRGAPAPVSER